MNIHLNYYLKRLIAKDNSVNRRNIYDELVLQDRRFKLFNYIDLYLKITCVRSVLSFLWGSYKFFKASIVTQGRIVTIIDSENELGVMNQFLARISDEKGELTQNKVKKNFQKFLKALFQVYKINVFINKKQPLLIACRASECLFMYLKLNQTHNSKNISLIISALSPHSAALLAISKEKQSNTVFLSNGLDSRPFFDEDVNVFMGGCPYNTAHLKEGNLNRDMLILEKSLSPIENKKIDFFPIKTVGIFLSGTVNFEKLKEILNVLNHSVSIEKILIRSHPNVYFKSSKKLLSDLSSKKVTTSKDSLSDDIGQCDLIIAGNSSVHVDCLQAGVMTFFENDLDHEQDNLFNYESSGFLPPLSYNIEGWENELKRVYLSENWKDIARTYMPETLKDDECDKIKKRLFG